MSAFAEKLPLPLPLPLPLSQRRTFDESRVSGDWRPVTAQCARILAEFLEAQAAAAWDTESIRPGWRVRDLVAELLWRADSTGVERAVERMTAVFRRSSTPAPDVAALAATPPHALVLRLHALARRRSEGVGRRNVGDLANVVSRAYEVSRSLGRHLELPAIATGAVCLSRILSAPLPIRAALDGRSLEATDAGWTVGHGLPLAAPAEQHVLFLFGSRSTLPGGT